GRPDHAPRGAEAQRRGIAGVVRLVDQRASAVERLRATPSRLAIVLVRTMPFHTRGAEDRFPQIAAGGELLEVNDVGFETILEDDAQRDARTRGFPDERVRPGGADF